MKFLSAVATLVFFSFPLVSVAKASWGNIFQAQTPIKTKGLPVKGDNPLVYCADPSAHLLQIGSVDLFPNPPKPYVSTYY